MTKFYRDRRVWDHTIWPMHELGGAELGLFFYHLADLGHAVVSREDNPLVRLAPDFCWKGGGGGGGGHIPEVAGRSVHAVGRRVLQRIHFLASGEASSLHWTGESVACKVWFCLFILFVYLPASHIATVHYVEHWHSSWEMGDAPSRVKCVGGRAALVLVPILDAGRYRV